MFKLGEKQFKVEEAVLFGGFCDSAMSKKMQDGNTPSFTWHLEINMDKQPFAYGESEDEDGLGFEYASPRLYHNNGFKLNIKSWKELEGVSLKWENTYNENKEEAGTLYVFEHEDVTSGKIQFLQRTNNIFRIRWSGTANVYWDDEFGEDIPFLFEDDVTFIGFSASCDEIFSLDELKNCIKPFINLEEYKLQREDTYNAMTASGKTYRCTFAPII